MGVIVLDDSMHKYAISLGVSGGDTKGKGVVIEDSVNNPRPTFNNGGAVVLSTVVLMVGITLVGSIGPYGSW